MIVVQKIGKSFGGALNYNLKKLNHPNAQMRAELLESNFSTLDAKLIGREVEMVRSLKPNLNRYVYHTSLNFSNEDFLDNSQMLQIAKEYLSGSGYTNNQYLIFRHYDAEHPHIHLLVNRITFEGKVVSDSNNYKRSEVLLRKLEAKYNLVTVEPSNKAAVRAITKSEIEMTERTGKPSDKLLLQELMNRLLSKKGMNINEFIQKGEQAGIHFLFNQASTGRITGITYFYNGLKIKGQALGNRYKWAELIKTITYEQGKHGQGISQANDRTTAKFGSITEPAGARTAAGNQRSGTAVQQAGGMGTAIADNQTDAIERFREREVTAGIAAGQAANGAADGSAGAGSGEAAAQDEQDAEAVSLDDRNNDGRCYTGTDLYGYAGIEIVDDIDDEAIHGRNRHRQKKARTNRR